VSEQFGWRWRMLKFPSAAVGGSLTTVRFPKNGASCGRSGVEGVANGRAPLVARAGARTLFFWLGVSKPKRWSANMTKFLSASVWLSAQPDTEPSTNSTHRTSAVEFKTREKFADGFISSPILLSCVSCSARDTSVRSGGFRNRFGTSAEGAKNCKISRSRTEICSSQSLGLRADRDDTQTCKSVV